MVWKKIFFKKQKKFGENLHIEYFPTVSPKNELHAPFYRILIPNISYVKFFNLSKKNNDEIMKKVWWNLHFW